MKGEVKSAVDFVSNLLRCRNMEPNKLERFRQKLHQVLANHYLNHWFPDKPTKGSGYRCIRIVNNKMDPLLDKAGAASGVSENELLSFLPSELTVWVDPSEVSYRIGEDGSIGVLFGDDVKEESDDEEEQQLQQPSS
ncbi:Protein BTG1, partial [Lamellibrachia satsuma]